MRGEEDNFLVSLVIWKGALLFSVAVDGVVVEGCDVVGFRLVEFGALVLELDSSFWSCSSLELGGVCRNGLLVEWLV